MSKKDREAVVALVISVMILVAIVVVFFTKDDIQKETNDEMVMAVANTTSEKIEEKGKTIVDDITQESQPIIESNETVNDEPVKEVVEQKEELQAEVSTRSKVVNNPVKVEQPVKVEKVEQQSQSSAVVTGYDSIGKIEIPKTGVNLPILSTVSVSGMEVAPCLLYSTGKLNESGNNMIIGHNFQNGKLFSNNKNLQIGDKIYITSSDGSRVEYTIYNKFMTTPEDVSFIRRDTNNKPEITLSCCSDDEQSRIIILAK